MSFYICKRVREYKKCHFVHTVLTLICTWCFPGNGRIWRNRREKWPTKRDRRTDTAASHRELKETSCEVVEQPAGGLHVRIYWICVCMCICFCSGESPSMECAYVYIAYMRTCAYACNVPKRAHTTMLDTCVDVCMSFWVYMY